MCVPYCAHAHCRFCRRGAGGPGGHYATAPAASVGRDISPTEGNYGVITATTYVRAPSLGIKTPLRTYARAREGCCFLRMRRASESAHARNNWGPIIIVLQLSAKGP